MGTTPGRAAMTAVNAQNLIASHSILAPTAAAAFSNSIQQQHAATAFSNSIQQ